MRNKKGLLLIYLGLLLIVGALFLTAYNFYDDYRAKKDAKQATDQLEKFLPDEDQEPVEEQKETEIPDYVLNPDMEMPVRTIDGQNYIGTLSIPSLHLELPIISEWNYPRLRIAPCRYEGSVYKDDMIIAGHNYRSHFGMLKNLSAGDQVIFTDMSGNRFFYQVTEMEVLNPVDVDEMEAGDWDLTLFTCTYGGQTRVTLRCKRIVIAPTLSYNK